MVMRVDETGDYRVTSGADDLRSRISESYVVESSDFDNGAVFYSHRSVLHNLGGTPAGDTAYYLTTSDECY
jgi:hypothetical protein